MLAERLLPSPEIRHGGNQYLGRPLSSLVEGDEHLDWPNSKKYEWNIAMHALHNIYGFSKNTNLADTAFISFY